MKSRRSAVRRQVRALPKVRFQRQALTSYAGLVLVMRFFTALSLNSRLRECFRHQAGGKIYSRATIFLQIIVHLVLGFRQLRDSRVYRDDPMVQQILGLRRLPDVATISRMLQKADERSVQNVRRLQQDLLFERLVQMGLTRITLDFDGSVQSTRRHAEGTAVGYNRKRKGERSYYPLFCTIAQTAQVLDFLHRSGNVHDSVGAQEFILACVRTVRQALPGVIIEVRMDSAFFSDEIVTALQNAAVEFTISVPFERFTELKGLIERRRRWAALNSEVSYFEEEWKPKVWDRRFRFLFIRTRAKRQIKGPLQLDLFIPHEYGYDFKVIVTNKDLAAHHIVLYHEGRGSQEGIFGELKSDCGVGYVPVRRRAGNQLYLLAGLLAHNLMREMQMRTTSPCRGTTPQRETLWAFHKLATFRKNLVLRAGRFTRPQGILTLTLNANAWVAEQFRTLLDALKRLKRAG